MRNRERSDDGHQRAKPPERNDQAKQKQQVIGSFKNMKETKLHKPKRGLVPAGVKPHQSRVAQKFERANNPRRRHKTQNRNNAQAQALKGRVNRELRTV